MRLVDFFFATRPVLHLPVWTIYLVTLQCRNQSLGESFAPIDAVMMAGLSLLFAGAYLINQVYDFETDRLNGKLGFLQLGLVSAKVMTAAFAIMSALAIAAGLLVSRLAAGVFLVIFFVSYGYSAPPFRLKDRPFGGLLANAFAYGLFVSVAVVSDMGLEGLRSIGWEIPSYFMLAVASVYCVTTIPDGPGDQATGKRTPAVTLGRTGALLAALVLMLLSVGVAATCGHFDLAAVSAIGVTLILLALVTGSERLVMAAAKLPLLLLTLLAGFFYAGYLLFVVALLFGTRIYYRKRFHMTYPRPA